MESKIGSNLDYNDLIGLGDGVQDMSTPKFGELEPICVKSYSIYSGGLGGKNYE